MKEGRTMVGPDEYLPLAHELLKVLEAKFPVALSHKDIAIILGAVKAVEHAFTRCLDKEGTKVFTMNVNKDIQ